MRKSLILLDMHFPKGHFQPQWRNFVGSQWVTSVHCDSDHWFNNHLQKESLCQSRWISLQTHGW